MRSKDNDVDECEPQTGWEHTGRLIAVGLISAVIGGLPISMLSSLHSREFLYMDFEGSRKWKRQVRRWHYKDAAIWFIAVAYILFTVQFILLFFANVNSPTQMDWITSSAVSFVETSILIPLIISLSFPFLAMGCLMVACLFSCVSRRENDSAKEEQHDPKKRQYCGSLECMGIKT